MNVSLIKRTNNQKVRHFSNFYYFNYFFDFFIFIVIITLKIYI